MARNLCVIFFICVYFQTVFCQLGFLQQNNNKKSDLLGFGGILQVKQDIHKKIHQVVEPHLEHIGVKPAQLETTTESGLPPFIEDIIARESFSSNQSSGLNSKTCETSDHELGSCISVYDCKYYSEVAQQSKEKAKEILKNQHCGLKEKEKMICCPNPTPASATPRSAIKAFPEAPICGASNASFDRIVGGVDAKLGDFPWMALLGYKTSRGTVWTCGGSLITSQHVLTAAHCIYGIEKFLYVVRLGELDVANENDGAHPIDVLIQEALIHEQYDSKAYTNDIALLTLKHDVQISDSIKPICLPKNEELKKMTFEGYNPLAAGWGYTKHRGTPSSHLKMVQVPVVGNEECQKLMKQKAKKKVPLIDQRVLCAGQMAGGKDACQGDSGGPLMQPWSPAGSKAHFYLIGVISWGLGCAEPDTPGVYIRVTNFLPWIEEKVLGHK